MAPMGASPRLKVDKEHVFSRHSVSQGLHFRSSEKQLIAEMGESGCWLALWRVPTESALAIHLAVLAIERHTGSPVELRLCL